ncbi:MAG TPA: family 16 glycoside hydrolase [Verrucomicrobiae bacterium]|nr:family 16 glycoside hydrolase [Verrucomicrobiae bacterium]
MSLALPGFAAEHTFDFSECREGQLPPGFRSALTGKGQPGNWQVIQIEVPSLMPALSPNAPSHAVRSVLAQLAQDPTDEHFPLLIYEDESYGDFTLTTRFETVKGAVERMAGIVFRLQDPTNYYVLRASSLGNTFRFYKVVNGERGSIIGPEISIPSGEWHELGVECKGNQIRCLFDGKLAIPTITDNSFPRGKIGFWTKSDSVSYFVDAKIVYIRTEDPARGIVRGMLKHYSRLLGLKIYVPGAQAGTTRLIASGDEEEIGKPGSKTEREVIARAETYYGKEHGVVSVVMPLRDRNGDVMAAVRVVMKSFAGQTEANAIERAAPIVKEIQAKVQTLDDLVEPGLAMTQ